MLVTLYISFPDIKIVSSSIRQDNILRNVQSTSNFTSFEDLFNQTLPRLLSEASSQLLQLMRERWSYTYQPLSIARFSFTQLSELEHCRVKQLPRGFITTAQDSKPVHLSRETVALQLSHCAHVQYVCLPSLLTSIPINDNCGTTVNLTFPIFKQNIDHSQKYTTFT